MKRNLILVITLDFDGYSYSFGNRKFKLFYNSCTVGSSALFDGLYKTDLNPSFANSFNTVIKIKRSKVNENSFMLWQKGLRHISRERMERLIKEDALHDLDFLNFNICID